MHFALPQRSSYPSRFSPRSTSLLRRRRLHHWAAIVSAVVFGFWFLSRYVFTDDAFGPPGTPPVMIVTVLDEKGLSPEYVRRIKHNRDTYAARHGYSTFYTNSTAYAEALNGADPTWAKIPAMRHAMTLYPHVPYFFHINAHSLITNPTFAVHKHLLKPSILERVMIRDKPIVPPDSVIKTLNLKGDHVDLVVTADNFGIATDSFIIKNGEWATYFLDTWFDPLYRSFNFQKADTHALEHIIQWHPTILTHLAVVPQGLLNAYSRGAKETLWKKDDFLIRFKDCERNDNDRNCERELDMYWQPLYGAQS